MYLNMYNEDVDPDEELNQIFRFLGDIKK